MRDLGEAIVALALVLAILGTVFEGIGYNESPQIVTLTSTRSDTSTTTGAGTSISTTSVSVVSTNVLYADRFFLPDRQLCYYDFRVVNLTKGQMYVAVTGATFWILSPDNYVRWMSRGGICLAPAPSEGLDVSSGAVQIPSSGPYYFVFLSQGDTRYSQFPIAPLVTFSVYSIQQSQINVTVKNEQYSTEETTFPTTITYTAEPVGFGLIYYLGNGLIVAAVVALVISSISAKRSRSRSGRKYT